MQVYEPNETPQQVHDAAVGWRKEHIAQTSSRTVVRSSSCLFLESCRQAHLPSASEACPCSFTVSAEVAGSEVSGACV